MPMRRVRGISMIALYKGLVGVLQVTFGLIVASSVSLSEILIKIAAGELAEDPQDAFLRWFFAHIGLLDVISHLGWILVLLGAVKIIIALGVWSHSRKFIKFSLIVFTATVLFAIYDVSVRFSWLELSAVVIDAGIIAYLFKTLPKRLNVLPAASTQF
jgi:uncharacterized membrane protein